MFNLLKLLYSVFFIYIMGAGHALTFKSDGSVIASSGETLTRSFAERYQTAINQYLNGEEVTDWPVVEQSSFGNPIKQKGFMGEKILGEGAPLFALPKHFAGDPVELISNNNGMVPDDFIQIMLATASNNWVEEKGFDQSIVDEAKANAKQIVENDFPAYKLTVITNEIIKLKGQNKNFQELENKNEFKILKSQVQNFFPVNDNMAEEIIKNNFETNDINREIESIISDTKGIIENTSSLIINDNGWTDTLKKDMQERIKKESESALSDIKQIASEEASNLVKEEAQQAAKEEVAAAASEELSGIAKLEAAMAAKEAAMEAMANAANEAAMEAAMEAFDAAMREELDALDELMEEDGPIPPGGGPVGP